MDLDPMLISGKYWKIKLNRYETKARIGAYQHERLLPQRLRLNVSVYVEKGSAPVNELSEVFNYDRIIEAIEVVVQEGHIDLQETLLERTAERNTPKWPQFRSAAKNLMHIQKPNLSALRHFLVKIRKGQRINNGTRQNRRA